MRPSLAIDSADTAFEVTLVILSCFQIHDPHVRLTLYTSDRCSRLPALAMSESPPGAPFSTVHLEILLLLQDPNQRPPPTPSALSSVPIWAQCMCGSHQAPRRTGGAVATYTRMCVQQCPCPQSAIPDRPTWWEGRRLWEHGCSLTQADRLELLPVPGPKAMRPTPWTRRPLHVCAGFTEQTGLRKKNKKREKENKESKSVTAFLFSCQQFGDLTATRSHSFSSHTHGLKS